ncbi:hypothetical protein QE152_g8307 [Popillia japonica]|uniref:Uncharacterized protein n=1 Tax=Popillia japonica TaxID=7064 RepID=A0AAW1MBY6_POPJA
MEDNFKGKKIRKFYKEVTNEGRGYQRESVFITETDGREIGDLEEKKYKWKCYLEEILDDRGNNANMEMDENTIKQ